VIIPADNIRDLEDIDPEARENLLFIPCKTADEVLKHALVREETASSSFMNIKEDISVNNTDISDNLTERPEVRALKTI
jgi:predicted ATP-dependent protease